MKSTQRSESMNSVIKRYLDPRQRLLDFFNHYERLLEERRHAELVADFYAVQGTPRVQFSDVLKQAASILTPSVFKIFRVEYGRFLDCSIYDSGSKEMVRTYIIADEGNEKRRDRTVRYDFSDNSITCSCLKFEFVGVQCYHVIKVLDAMNIKQLPYKYYLKRWRKDAKAGRALPLEEVNEIDPKVDIANRYSSLMRTYNSILSKGSQSQRANKYAIESAEELMSNIEAILLEESAEQILNVDPSNQEKKHNNVSVHTATPKVSPITPKCIITKDGGRGRKRIKHGLEKNTKKAAKSNINSTKHSLSKFEKDKNLELVSIGSTLPASPLCFTAPLVYGSASQLLNTMHALSSLNTGPGMGIGQTTISRPEVPITEIGN